MSIAPKIMNCRVNITYFVKNHEILLNYIEENEEQIPWKHNVIVHATLVSYTFFKNKRCKF